MKIDENLETSDITEANLASLSETLRVGYGSHDTELLFKLVGKRDEVIDQGRRISDPGWPSST